MWRGQWVDGLPLHPGLARLVGTVAPLSFPLTPILYHNGREKSIVFSKKIKKFLFRRNTSKSIAKKVEGFTLPQFRPLQDLHIRLYKCYKSNGLCNNA
jgi:hypothetical protein